MSGGLAVENLTFNQTARRPLPEIAPCCIQGAGLFGKVGGRKVPKREHSGHFGNGNGPLVITGKFINYRLEGANYDRKP